MSPKCWWWLGGDVCRVIGKQLDRIQDTIQLAGPQNWSPLYFMSYIPLWKSLISFCKQLKYLQFTSSVYFTFKSPLHSFLLAIYLFIWFPSRLSTDHPGHWCRMLLEGNFCFFPAFPHLEDKFNFPLPILCCTQLDLAFLLKTMSHFS